MSRTVIRTDAKGLRCQGDGHVCRPVLEKSSVYWEMWGQPSTWRFEQELALGEKLDRSIRFRTDGASAFEAGDHVTSRHIGTTTMVRVSSPEFMEIWWIDEGALAAEEAASNWGFIRPCADRER